MDKTEKIAFFIIIFLSFMIRLIAGYTADMYVDECFAYYLAHQDVKSIILFSMTDSNPFLNYFILKPILYFSSDKLVLRLPSIIFSLISLYFIFLTAKLISNRNTALLTTLLCGISYSCWVSQSQMRMYGLAMLAVAISFYILTGWIVQAEKFDKKKYTIAFILVNIIMPFIHYTMISCVLSAVLCSILFIGKNIRKKAVIGLILSLLIFASWYAVIKISNRDLYLKIGKKTGVNQAGSVGMEISRFSTYVTGLDLPFCWSFMRGKNPTANPILRWLILFTSIVCYLIFVLGFFVLKKNDKKASIALLLFFLTTFLMIAIISLAGFSIQYQIRYNIFIFPLFFLFMSAFLINIIENKKAYKMVTWVFVSYFAIVGIYTGFFEFTKDSYFWFQDWQKPAEFIQRNQKQGDIIAAFIPYSLMGLDRTYMQNYISWDFKPGTLMIEQKINKEYYEKGGLPQIPITLSDIPDGLNQKLGNNRIFLILNQHETDRSGMIRKYFIENYNVISGIQIEAYTGLGYTEVYLLKRIEPTNSRQ